MFAYLLCGWLVASVLCNVVFYFVAFRSFFLSFFPFGCDFVAPPLLSFRFGSTLRFIVMYWRGYELAKLIAAARKSSLENAEK